MNSPLYFSGAPQPWRQHTCEREPPICRGCPYLGGAKYDNRPPGFEDRLVLTSSFLDGTDNTQSPLQRGSHVFVDLVKIVPNDADLIPVSRKQGAEFFVVHTPIDRPFADLEPIHMNDG